MNLMSNFEKMLYTQRSCVALCLRKIHEKSWKNLLNLSNESLIRIILKKIDVLFDQKYEKNFQNENSTLGSCHTTLFEASL